MKNKQKAYIFDIDGTISDDTHRKYWAKNKEWDKYHERCIYDDPIDSIVEILNSFFRAGNKIIFMTGRPSEYVEQTKRWICNNTQMHYDNIELYMRPKENVSSNEDLKKSMYNAFIRNKYDVVSAFDDNQKTLDMWNSIGISCVNVDKNKL